MRTRAVLDDNVDRMCTCRRWSSKYSTCDVGSGFSMVTSIIDVSAGLLEGESVLVVAMVGTAEGLTVVFNFSRRAC